MRCDLRLNVKLCNCKMLSKHTFVSHSRSMLLHCLSLSVQFWLQPAYWLYLQTPFHDAPVEYPGGGEKKKYYLQFLIFYLKKNSRSTLHEYIWSLGKRAYLISRSDDKNPTQNKSFTPEISPEAPPVGSPEVSPHTNTQEHGEKHPPLLGAIKISLCEKKKNPENVAFHLHMEGVFFSVEVEWQTFWSRYTFPEKNFLKQSSSLPRFSFTTANRGTSMSCSWDFREESSAASWWQKSQRTSAKLLNSFTMHICHRLPLCTIIIQVVAQPWPQHQSSPTGVLLYASHGLRERVRESSGWTQKVWKLPTLQFRLTASSRLELRVLQHF